MKNIIFCNIGNQDILLADESKEEKWQPARLRGERLNRAFPELAERLSLPIIEPVITYALERHEKIDKLVLVGTDQPDTDLNNRPDTKGIAFRDKDTVYYGHVAQRWIKQKYQPRFGQIKAEHVTVNPSLYDEAFDAYADLLQKHSDDSIERCYVVAVGGTPACNTALLLQAVRCFGQKCRMIYVPETDDAHELQMGRQIWETMQENTAISRLNQYDFAAAYALLEKQELPEATLALIDYARLRLDFDFDTAQIRLQTAINRGKGAAREFARTIRHDLDKLREGDDLVLIGEVYQNALICWENGRYVDFLGRIFRIQEASLRYLISHFYGLGTDATKDQNQFTAYIDKYTPLRDYITSQKFGDAPMSYNKINIPVLLVMLNYIGDHGHTGDPNQPVAKDERKRCAVIAAILKRIGKLSSLRNKSIIAHGYRGVSKEIILEEYTFGDPAAAHDLLDDLKTLCAALKVSLDNPFEKVKKNLIKQLKGRNSR